MNILCHIFLYSALFLAAFPLPASAQTFVVNSIEDVDDLNPGDGLCVSYLIVIPPFVLPFCTLRGAIEEANTLPGKDRIKLPSSMIALTLQGPAEDGAQTGDLDITESLDVIGGGADSTFIDGRMFDRIFDIASNVTVSITGVSLLNGRVGKSDSGSVRGGGAIRNSGNLLLENVIFLNNQVREGGMADLGGALLNSGQCDMVNSTIQQSEAFEGGAIYNDRGALLTILSSTLSENNAGIGAGVSNYGTLNVLNSTISGNGSVSTQYGGGLENRRYATLRHSTLAFNQATFGGGISNKSPLYLQNSLLGINTGGDCHGPKYLYSNGHNLTSDTSCVLTEPSDISGEDPLLLPLNNNGGTTLTHRLSPLSPARDRGVLIPELHVDQRGMQRPVGQGVDIGSVENEEFSLPPIIFPLVGYLGQ